jgi:hypothetical protein
MNAVHNSAPLSAHNEAVQSSSGAAMCILQYHYIWRELEEKIVHAIFDLNGLNEFVTDL